MRRISAFATWKGEKFRYPGATFGELSSGDAQETDPANLRTMIVLQDVTGRGCVETHLGHPLDGTIFRCRGIMARLFSQKCRAAHSVGSCSTPNFEIGVSTHPRPGADFGSWFMMLQCGLLFLPFAAGAKSRARRTGGVRTKPPSRLYFVTAASNLLRTSTDMAEHHSIKPGNGSDDDT